LRKKSIQYAVIGPAHRRLFWNPNHRFCWTKYWKSRFCIQFLSQLCENGLSVSFILKEKCSFIQQKLCFATSAFIGAVNDSHVQQLIQ